MIPPLTKFFNNHIQLLSCRVSVAGCLGCLGCLATLIAVDRPQPYPQQLRVETVETPCDFLYVIVVFQDILNRLLPNCY